EGVIFDEAIQRLPIAATLNASAFQRFRLHGMSTDSTHVHMLLRWRHERSPLTVAAGTRQSLTRALNAQVRPRTWLSDGASRNPVDTQEHFNHLLETDLPKRGGWKWRDSRGYYR